MQTGDPDQPPSGWRKGQETGVRKGEGELREPGTRQAGQDLECQVKTPGLYPEGHWESRRALGRVDT